MVGYPLEPFATGAFTSMVSVVHSPTLVASRASHVEGRLVVTPGPIRYRGIRTPLEVEPDEVSVIAV